VIHRPSLIAPIALLVAMLTVTTLFAVGLGEAPRDLFGGKSVLIMGPPGDALPGQGGVAMSFAEALENVPGGLAKSGEIFVPTTFRGDSIMARGADLAAFLAIENATTRPLIAASTLAPSEVVLGRAFATRYGLEVGDTIGLTGAYRPTRLTFTVVATHDASGSTRDELVIPLAAARALSGQANDQVDLIRIAANDTSKVAALITAVAPQFTYSHVRLSSTDIVEGELATAYAQVTNWGLVDGTKVVEVKQGETVVGQRGFLVPARTTLNVEVPFSVRADLEPVIRINPSFAIEARSPSLRLDMPAAAPPGETTHLRVLLANGLPAPPGLRVDVGDERLATQDGGVVSYAAALESAAGFRRIVAYDGERVGVVGRIWVPATSDAARFAPRVEALATLWPLIQSDVETTLSLRVMNVGGRAGPYTLDVLVDGEAVNNITIDLAPGQTRTFTPRLPAVVRGYHNITTSAGGHIATEAVPLDPEVEVLLRAHAARARGEGPDIGTTGASPDDYVQRVIGDVRAAVLALALASGVLTTLAAVAVIARHTRDAAGRLGDIKAIGANDIDILDHVTLEVGSYGALGSLLGVVVGVAVGRLIAASGLVRAFGHAVAPVAPWWLLGVIFLGSLLAVSVIGRAHAAAVLRHPIDALQRGQFDTRTTPPPFEAIFGGRR